MMKTKPAEERLQYISQASVRAMYTVGFFSMCINILMLATPLYMLQVFDRVLTSRSIDTLLLLTLITGFAILSMALLEAVRSAMVIRIGQWVDGSLSASLLQGTIAGTLNHSREPSIQPLRDLQTCRTFISGSEIFSFLDSPWAPVYILIIFLLHPLLGSIALGGALVLFVLAVINEMVSRLALQRAGELNISAMRQADAAVRNADVIEAMGMMPDLVRRWGRDNAEGIRIQSDASFRNGLIVVFSRFIRMLLQIAMLGVGAWLVIQGMLSPGGMIVGSILMGRALSPVEQAINSWKSAIAARNAYNRLKLHINAIPDRADSMRLPAPSGELQLENVTYAHPGNKEATLKGINFNLQAGKALGVIGPSSSGKTTLLRLMLGNLKPNIGQVRLDGMDVVQWSADDLGRYCGYLPQDIELFSASVRENIARMAEGDADAVIDAARLAGCHEMILRLPAGYETQVGEGGAALSGGERQRIALARALYGAPRFVVLDEPNANLDAVGEAALLNAMEKLRAEGVTVVIVGHRPNVVQHVDYLLVLQEGRVQQFDEKDRVLARLAENARNANVAGIKRHG